MPLVDEIGVLELFDGRNECRDADAVGGFFQYRIEASWQRPDFRVPNQRPPGVSLGIVQPCTVEDLTDKDGGYASAFIDRGDRFQIFAEVFFKKRIAAGGGAVIEKVFRRRDRIDPPLQV